MRQLLGKYASEGSVSIGGSSGGLSFLPMSRSAQKGTAARPDVPLSPVPPLSPAFAAAAEQHRAQLGAHLPEEEPEAPPMGTPLEGDILAAEALLASTAEKLASNPALLDAYRDKYPFVAASAERLAAGSGGAALAQAPSHQAHYDASWLQPVGGTRQVYEEESTMELKSQIIFNRALPRGGQTHAAATPSVGAAPLATPASAAPMDRAPPPPHPTPASIASGNGPGGNEVRSKESLQEAIAVALGRHAGTAAAPTPQAATPAAALTTQSAGTRGFPSARSARSSLTPSLPSAVPPYRAVGAAEYSTLPAFIRGQLPLEALNQAASGVHSVAVRRCAAGEGASFSMDDVESAGELPAGKGKVLVNALAKLGHVQLKVLYGQGTVYFFS